MRALVGVSLAMLLQGCGSMMPGDCVANAKLSMAVGGAGVAITTAHAESMCAAADRGDTAEVVRLTNQARGGDLSTIEVAGGGSLPGAIAGARALLNEIGTCPQGGCGDRGGVAVGQSGVYGSVRATCPDCSSRAGQDWGPARGGGRWVRSVTKPGAQPDGSPTPGGAFEFGRARVPDRAAEAAFKATGDAYTNAIRRRIGGDGR